VATGIAQDGITPELGSEFHSKGLLYLSPEAWLTHAKATGIDPCVIDFVMTNPYSYLGINRLVTENGNIASEADIERWNTEESHIPWSIRYDDGCYPNPFKIQEVSNLLDFWKEEWRSNEGRYKVRDHYPNYYQYVQKGVGTFCGRKWAYDFAKFLVSIGDGKEFYS